MTELKLHTKIGELTGVFVQDAISGKYTAFFKERDNIITQGKDINEATEHLQDLLSDVLEHEKITAITTTIKNDRTCELIAALKSGFGVKKKHYYKTYDVGELRSPDDQICGIEFLFYDNKHKYFERKGWSTAFGSTEARIMELITKPEDWEIAGKIEDREWIKINSF